MRRFTVIIFKRFYLFAVKLSMKKIVIVPFAKTVTLMENMKMLTVAASDDE